MSVRVRFAPSPTGQVHIGNIRTGIFDWLFARHEGGAFLVRVEDTDLERSTPEAIKALFEVMDWLGIDYDDEPLYQTSQLETHLAAATKLLAAGDAYRSAKGGAGEATVFRIPWDAEAVPGVSVVGPVELVVHPDVPVVLNHEGISYAQVSRKGKPMPQVACLAGFKDLEISDADGTVLFTLNDSIQGILAGDEAFEIPGATTFRFTRRQVAYDDIVKGRLAKPLDSMKDQVIVRSNGSPIFHLANVCDDVTQGITHIVRGDDHVENTYRHIFLFAALGATPPKYGHLPMIVNQQGKPYSKRDGDAFVGDFRAKGYLPQALFNYLTLLGWSPGDDREKMSRDEIVDAFTLDRVQHASAQMDLRKLLNLNGQYMAEIPLDEFISGCREALAEADWAMQADAAYFAQVAELMQTRTKLFTDAASWQCLFVDIPEYEAKGCRKFLQKPGVKGALEALVGALADTTFTVDTLEAAIQAVTESAGFAPGKLNQAIRVAITGCTVGAGIYETMELLGKDRSLARLQYAIGNCSDAPAQ
ncbi:MAG: glutamate--tRNA ligase [Lentisphaerae bacterium]|jgi:glutamyl-tRNA synthetase|nr:glutamate--tRNA ligase [Lentisphaerota bacterium]MBT4819547.1 glutamate--tRNA ligase [Lentisphaerota bacterium]MBT5605475.1 glutamate--tRNA ligase [Lentisphaerota bacterium]MBT7060094.1 glutamate--tRNA ligase [Lentisphaerota bacterium]MBT7840846.1 glutamate--tRNA ligase [Lentisphaerota bacterium]